MKLIGGLLGLGCVYLIYSHVMPAWAGALCLIGIAVAIYLYHMG